MNNQLIKPSTFNFKELVNTNISINLESKFVDKLKDKFDEEELQVYVLNLYGYLNFHPTDDFPINLEEIINFVGFANKGNAKRMLENNFIEGEDYKIIERNNEKSSLLPREKRSHGVAGGENKEKIIMNIDTFKQLCMLVKSEKAKKIRKYYVKLENVYNELLVEANQENQLLLKEKESIHESDKKLERHKLLLKIYSKKKCVYLVELPNNRIKIGSSSDIEERVKSIKQQFGGNGMFLDVFECEHILVEREILNNYNVIQNKFKGKLETGHTSTEVVQLNEQFNYAQLLEIVEKSVNMSITCFTPAQRIEMKKLSLIEKFNGNIELLDETINKLNTFLDSPVVSAGPSTQIERPRIIKNRNFGKKIQQIDKNNLNNIIKVHEDMQSLLIDPVYSRYYETGIRTAIADNKEYKGFRWLFVEENQDPTVVNNIQPTVVTRSSVYCILKLDKERTKIVKHYESLGVAARENGITDRRLRTKINARELYNEHYYIKYEDCEEEMLNNYDGIVEYVPKNALSVKAIHPETKAEKVYVSLRHAHEELGIHHKTVRRAIKNNTISYGYFWKLC